MCAIRNDERYQALSGVGWAAKQHYRVICHSVSTATPLLGNKNLRKDRDRERVVSVYK